MSTRLLEKTRPTPPRHDGLGGGGDRWNGDGGGSRARALPPNTAILGIAVALAAIAMLFVAFTTTYIAHSQAPGWVPVPLPGILWFDTAVLLASSVTLEWGRARLRRGDAAGLRQGLEATAGLGGVFLLGQLMAWRQLASAEVYLSTNPHSSFFYLLTGVHGLHLLGGLVALGVVLWRAWERCYASSDQTGVNVFALYWHFLDGLWLYVFGILFWA